MIGYITLGTNDLAAASAFYDELLAEMDAARVIETDRLIVWTTAPGASMLGVCIPHDGGEATVSNGGMTALAAGSKENVDKLHARALALGGSDEGAPGERMPGFYGGYFRDLDGNKLVAFYME